MTSRHPSNGTLAPSLPRIKSAPGSNNNYAAFASNNFGTLSNNNYEAFVASNDLQLSSAEETSTEASPPERASPVRPKKKNVANFVEPEEAPAISPTTEGQQGTPAQKRTGWRPTMVNTRTSRPAGNGAPKTSEPSTPSSDNATTPQDPSPGKLAPLSSTEVAPFRSHSYFCYSRSCPCEPEPTVLGRTEINDAGVDREGQEEKGGRGENPSRGETASCREGISAPPLFARPPNFSE